MIGVSVEYNLVMNSLAIPRKAKQAVGAIAKLTQAGTGAPRGVFCVFHRNHEDDEDLPVLL